MTIGGIVSVGFLIVLVGLILWGIRGHRGGGDGPDNDYGPGSGGTGTDKSMDIGMDTGVDGGDGGGD